jgi:hypothetical protein
MTKRKSLACALVSNQSDSFRLHETLSTFNAYPSFRYDSEEERLRERCETMRRRRRMQSEAAEQMEKLHRYRTQQDAASKVAAGAYHANIAAGRGTYGWERTRRATSASLPDDAAAMAAHEECWEKFADRIAASNEAAIAYEHVPWPPFGSDYRRYLVALADMDSARPPKNVVAVGGLRLDIRRAYMQAQLRYHPDKFQHKYAIAVLESDRKKVMEAIHVVSQGLNAAWKDLNDSNEIH